MRLFHRQFCRMTLAQRARHTALMISRQAEVLAMHAVALCVMLSGALIASAGQYEQPGPRTVDEALEPEWRDGPHDHIEEPVQHDGYMHTYTVVTDYGVFLSQGDSMLRRLRRELAAISDLRQRYAVGAAGESAVKVLIKPISAVGRLAFQPKETLLGIPRGAYRLLESTVKAPFIGESGSYEDSSFKSLLQVSAYKRRIAAHYHVDVYSSNPILQLELDRVAWASVAGYTTTFAMLFVPASVLTLSLGGLNSVEMLNKALEEMGPDDLRLFNLRTLRSIGISKELAEEFLAQPFYSPRHQTIIASCLESLSNAKRRDRFLKATLNALSEEEAVFYQQAAELLRAYNQQVQPIVEITMLGRVPLGRAKGHRVFFPAPVDYAIWMESTDKLFDRLAKTIRQGKGSEKIVDVWVTGTISPLARQELLNRGIAARERMSRELDLSD